MPALHNERQEIMKAVAVSACVAAIIGGLAYWQLFINSPTDTFADQASVKTPSGTEGVAGHAGILQESLSPFAVANTDVSSAQALKAEGHDAAADNQQAAPTLQGNAQLPDWGAPLGEAQLSILVERLRLDPALLQQLMDEFRQENDPTRKALLASVLGEVGGDEVTLLASELIFSGSASERSVGLNLLQAVQPGNASARDIVSSMLSTEVEPDVLTQTLTVLARPGDVDEASRAYLADQVAWLTTHEDVNVRGMSLDVLSRWSREGQHTDVFVRALDDESANVRASAAYALVGQDVQSTELVDRLFTVLEDTEERASVKSAATLALNSLALSPTQQARLDALVKARNTATR